MAKLRRLALAGIPVVSCGWANAADLPPAPPLPEQTAEEEFSGWYLRGDVGGGVNSGRPELEIAPEATAASAGGAVGRFDNATLSPFGIVDVGAGYQFNSWFRADATIEYRGGASLRSGATYAWAGPAQTGNTFRADVASFVGLVNGYVTPGAWYGFSPVLGAGVGFADNRLSSVSAFGSGWGGRFASGSRMSFAWAAMAGVDYGLTANLKLELSYRYLSYGTGATGRDDAYPGLAGPISSRNRLASNDFRLGLIYLIGEAHAPPIVAGQ
jgi:opacity protein-like surface antigen